MNSTNNKHLEAEFNQLPAKSVGTFDIESLKDKANKSFRKRYRICLHHSTDHLTQEMIICLKGFNYFRPHKHPLMYSESYHLIEGALDVYLFDDDGAVIQIIKLASPNFKSGEKRDTLYRLSKPIFHLVIPRTEWTIYHEVATGPFNKNKSVEHAPFAPLDDCDSKEALEYCKKVTKNNIHLL
jgi:glucose-6-phosphate isomerase|tara:strand:+ start:395 stop:943 length:549 start_codon:yes stop_codon:yes gene_type:complete